MEVTRQSWDPKSIFAEGFLVAVFVAGWRRLADRLGQAGLVPAHCMGEFNCEV